MKILSGSTRNKLMIAGAFAAAAVLATPVAMARDHYGHGNRSGDMLGALIVGAVIGGVVASASSHHDRYYYDNDYYAPQPYPSSYYGYSSYPTYPAYPAYGYGGYYGSGVNVGVRYSSGRNDWRGHDRSDYRGSNGYYYGGSQGRSDHRGSHGRSDHRGNDRGHYYSRHGH